MQHKAPGKGMRAIATATVVCLAVLAAVLFWPRGQTDASISQSGAPLVGTPTSSGSPESASGSTGSTGSVLPSAVARPKMVDASGPGLPPYKVIQARKPFRLKPVPVDLSYTFRAGTFNILGSNHTRHSNQWASGVVRARHTADLIRGRGINLIGMQEVQPDQLHVLDAQLSGYSIWPRETLGNSGVRLQIAWSDSLFELVDTGTITTVFSHQMRPVPWVKLRDRSTGGEFYFVTLHNSPRGLESERDRATGPEIDLLNSLLSTGLPVMVSGDTNEPSEFFCRVGAATGMVAANGGDATGGCRLPPSPTGLDWLMGGNGTSFSGYVRDHVAGTSDHPIVYSSVTLTTTVMRVPESDNG